jgi:hypothetical protein
MISTIGGEYHSSVDRLLERAGALVSAVVDMPMERECEVTVFLPENAYVAEVSNCVDYGEHFKIDLSTPASPRYSLGINGGYAEATDT